MKNKEDRYHKIMEIKMKTTPEELCKGFPRQFENYIRYCRNLEYTENPEYNYLKKLFTEVLKGYTENIFDWDIVNKTMITATTSSTSRKPITIENKKEKTKKINVFSERVMSTFMNNRTVNFKTICSKDDCIDTNRSRINNKYENLININDEYENMAEFTEEENIKKKCPNNFGIIHNKRQLEKSFEISKKKDEEFCLII